MTLDELIEQLTMLRTVSSGARFANVRVVTAALCSEQNCPVERSDRPLERVFYQGGEIVLATRD